MKFGLFWKPMYRHFWKIKIQKKRKMEHGNGKYKHRQMGTMQQFIFIFSSKGISRFLNIPTPTPAPDRGCPVVWVGGPGPFGFRMSCLRGLWCSSTASPFGIIFLIWLQAKPLQPSSMHQSQLLDNTVLIPIINNWVIHWLINRLLKKTLAVAWTAAV